MKNISFFCFFYLNLVRIFLMNYSENYHLSHISWLYTQTSMIFSPLPSLLVEAQTSPSPVLAPLPMQCGLFHVILLPHSLSTHYSMFLTKNQFFYHYFILINVLLPKNNWCFHSPKVRLHLN